jgi:Gpi18-like mannosyltransferase
MFQKVKKSIINYLLKTLIVGGLLLRLALLFLDFSFDVNSYLAWAKEALKFGLRVFMKESHKKDTARFSPTIHLWLSFFLFFFSTLSAGFFACLEDQSGFPFFSFKSGFFLRYSNSHGRFLKIPAVFFDLATVILIYKFVKKIKAKTFFSPLVAAVLLLFNPGFFYNSSYLGQIEIIPIFFILLAFYLFFSDKNSFWPLPFLTLALLSKQTAIIFLPLLIFCYLKERGWFSFFRDFFLSLFYFIYSFFLSCRQG